MKFYYDFIKLFTKKCENDDVGTPTQAYYLKPCLIQSLFEQQRVLR